MATIEGSTYEGVASTIQWGDGTSLPGTVVDVSGTLELEGAHTYDRAGYYALGVYVDVVAPDSNASNYAADVVDVIAPTDGFDPEMVTGYSLSGGGEDLGEDAWPTNTTPTLMQFSASASTVVGYTLEEAITEPNDYFTLLRQGSFSFNLSESESSWAFVQPNSEISVTNSETFTKNENDGQPTLIGTTTDVGSLTYALSETGTGDVV